MDSEIRKQLDVMPCRTTDKTIAELESEGWESLYSFHHTIPEQFQDACKRAEQATASGLYEVVLVLGQTELEKKDGVQYLYKRKTEKLLSLEKQHGH
ncbi:MAG: hypothetical protein WC817_01655 [Patescibacteria group bacterium]|jgi:hypothetical protein